MSAVAVGLLVYSQPVLAEVPTAYSTDYQDGYDVAYPVGYASGYDAGLTRGRTAGTSQGKADGFADGWDVTYQPAFDSAFDAARPVGEYEGYADSFPTAAADGYQWASELHRVVTQQYSVNQPAWVDPFTKRWGDPRGWGSVSLVMDAGFLGGSGIGGSGSLFFVSAVEELAKYNYERGYDDGYSAGFSFGDQAGYDETFPIAYAAAYGPAYDRGLVQGEAQGRADGYDEGYDEGWDLGVTAGETDGFTAGADLYMAGGSLGDLRIADYLSAYRNDLAFVAAPAANRVSVPEPTAVLIAGIGVLAATCSRRRIV